MSKRKPVVEIWQSVKNKKWYFHKKNANGKITEPSQGYSHKRSAVHAARRDIPNVPIVTIVNNRWWK